MVLAVPGVKPTTSRGPVAGWLLTTESRTKPLAPDAGSVTVTVAVTGMSLRAALNRLGMTTALHTGGVLSIRIGPKKAAGSALLPALSVQPPITPPVVPWVLTVMGAAVVATPDWSVPVSVQAKVTTTSWLVHVPAV